MREGGLSCEAGNKERIGTEEAGSEHKILIIGLRKGVSGPPGCRIMLLLHTFFLECELF